MSEGAAPMKSLLSLPLTAWLACLMLFAGVAAPFLLGSYELNLLARFLAFALAALGIVLTWGHGGILSLGQGVFFGLGGYALAMHMKLATLGEGELPDFMMWSGLDSLPWWWQPFENPAFALFGVVLLPALLAVLFGWAMFHRRISGTYFALITQALALAFATLLVSQQETTGGFNGLTDFQTLFGLDLLAPGTARLLYWITLALVAAAVIGTSLLLRSRFGILLRATRDGENRVRFLGYNPTPYKVIAFALAAALTGLGGALFTLHAGVISPAMVGVIPSIEMIIWVAVGGRTSLIGALVATLVVNFARDGISSAFPDLWLYTLGGLFILAVTLLPKGLAGLGETAAAFRRKPAAV